MSPAGKLRIAFLAWGVVALASVPCARDALAQVASPPVVHASAIASNSTTPGALTAYATLLSAGFEWRITGDDDADCAVALEYRKSGELAWKPAQQLLRVEHGLWTHDEDPGNLLAGSLFFLEPATDYEARLTLADPDGGSEQRIVAFSTRGAPAAAPARTLQVTPGSGGGSGTESDPFRGLAAADAAAQPGDVFVLGPGTYHGKFTVTRDGTAGAPIVYRGVTSSAVILDGDGGTSTSSHCISLVGRQHVSLENVSLVNCLRPINADSSLGIVLRGCFIQPVNLLVGTEGIRAAISRDLLIANNTILMPGQWAAIGRTGSYGSGGYGIMIEGTGHVVCHNTIVESWDAISLPATGAAVPACTTSNVDIYENFVDRASDDGIQADAIQHNVRVYRNRLLNTGSAVSFQPSFGGPGYVLFNEMFNTRIEPYKFHQETSYGWTQETSGFFAFHNTSISNRNGWLDAGIWHHATFRNNLVLGGRPNASTLQINYPCYGASFDYDGFNRVNGYPYLVYFVGSNYANLPAFFAGTDNEQHGIEVGIGEFVKAVFPHHPEWNYPDGYGAAYSVSDVDLRLVPGSVAIDRGSWLANINEGFAGSSPDLGCYERGAPLPAYGARAAGEPLSAGAAADVTSGEAPLTVHFSGASMNAKGIVVAYHWNFGDSGGVSDEQNPVHTYTGGGTFSPVLTVIDDDGSVATAATMVLVSPPSTGVTPHRTELTLSQNEPNPFHRGTTIRFSLPERATIRLAVYDLRGALVRDLAGGEYAGGEHAAVWDGRANDGRQAEAGVYLLRLIAGDRQLTRRVVRVK